MICVRWFDEGREKGPKQIDHGGSGLSVCLSVSMARSQEGKTNAHFLYISLPINHQFAHLCGVRYKARSDVMELPFVPSLSPSFLVCHRHTCMFVTPLLEPRYNRFLVWKEEKSPLEPIILSDKSSTI